MRQSVNAAVRDKVYWVQVRPRKPPLNSYELGRVFCACPVLPASESLYVRIVNQARLRLVPDGYELCCGFEHGSLLVDLLTHRQR